MNNKVKNIVSLFLDFIVFLLSVIGFLLMFFLGKDSGLSSHGFSSLRYFTVLSNLFMGLISFLMFISMLIAMKKRREMSEKWLVLSHVATVSVTITFLVVAFFLAIKAQLDGRGYFSMFRGSNLIFHFILPVLAILNFTIFEKGKKMPFYSLFFAYIPIVLYGIFYVCNFYFHWVISNEGNYDWYGFLSNGNAIQLMLVLFAFILITFLISFGLAFFNGLSFRKDKVEVCSPPKEKEEEVILSDDVVGFTRVASEKARTINEVVESTEDYDKVQETVSTETGTIHVITKKVMKAKKKEQTK